MALIKCLECRQEISNKAPVCPHCGNPSEDAKTILIERTKKKWKKLWLIALSILFIGLFFFIKGFLKVYNGEEFYNTTTIFGLIVVVIAGVIGVIIRIGVWWDHR